MSGIDYYRILGIPPSATRRAIREAYLGKVRRLHPDRVGPGGTALFQQIAEAYENLSDPEKRRIYDHECRTAVRSRYPNPEGIGFASEAEPLAQRPKPAAYRSAASSPVGLDELLQTLIGGHTNPFATHSPSDIIELEVVLTRREALRGAVLPLELPVYATCRWCGGGGRNPYLCRACGGSGEEAREQNFRIQIPPAIRDGSVMDIPLSRDRVGGVHLRIHITVSGETGFW